LLVWLAGVWIIYATPATDRLYPHYLIVTFPASFTVQAIGLAGLVALIRSVSRTLAVIAAVATMAVIVIANAAFTLSFHDYVDRAGGTAGDYGVSYRHKAALAAAVRERGARVADEDVIDLLVTGEIGAPVATAPLVTVTDRIHNVEPPCEGELQSFGPLDACFPP
jgi:hypothetical protein